MKKYLFKYLTISVAIGSLMIHEANAIISFDSDSDYNQSRIPRMEPTGVHIGDSMWNIILFQYIIPLLLLCIIVWGIIIYPYRFYRKYQELTPEERSNTLVFFPIEQHIAYWVLALWYLWFTYTLFTDWVLYRLVDILRVIMSIVLIHYIILLVYGIKLYISNLKEIGKKVLKWIHLFLFINYLIGNIIFWLLRHFSCCW